MKGSITETLKKINTEVSFQAFLAVAVTLVILSGFFIYESYQNQAINKSAPVYTESNFTPKKDTNFIYASSRGSKYYYTSCEANIKESNKIYFATEAEAVKAGYTLAKSCE